MCVPHDRGDSHRKQGRASQENVGSVPGGIQTKCLYLSEEVRTIEVGAANFAASSVK